MEQWYRFPLGHGCAEYQALRDVRRLRLQYDEGTGPQTVFPVMLDRDDISLWLYLPPGNDDLARRLAALPCPCLEQQPDRLVKLSEEYLELGVEHRCLGQPTTRAFAWRR